jgi:hypothetical protein
LLIVDDLFTMTAKHFVAIEQQLFLTMRDSGRTHDSPNSMLGGIGVILTGDHHQRQRVLSAPLFQSNGDIRSGMAADVPQRTPSITAPDGIMGS